MGVELFEKIAERYPFITFCTYAGNEYVGVIPKEPRRSNHNNI